MSSSSTRRPSRWVAPTRASPVPAVTASMRRTSAIPTATSSTSSTWVSRAFADCLGWQSAPANARPRRAGLGRLNFDEVSPLTAIRNTGNPMSRVFAAFLLLGIAQLASAAALPDYLTLPPQMRLQNADALTVEEYGEAEFPLKD